MSRPQKNRLLPLHERSRPMKILSTCLPPPMLAILIGTGILLVQFVYTFIKIRQGEDVE